MRIVALLGLLGLPVMVGCGSQLLCQAIAAEYAAALPAAKACDVAARDSCGANRLMSLGGQCACSTAVNPDQTATLDEINARYDAAGCPEGLACPCPGYVTTCNPATDGGAVGVCP